MKILNVNKGILLLATLLLTITAHSQKKPASTSSPKTSDAHRNYIDIDEDNVTGESIVDYKMGNDIYKFKMRGDKITELYVGDKKIAEEDYAKYEPQIKKIMVQVKKDRETARLDMLQAKKDQEQAMKDQEMMIQDQKQALMDQKMALDDQQRAMKEKIATEHDAVQVKKDKQMAEMDRQRAGADQQRAEKDLKQSQKDLQQAELDKKRSDEDRETMISFIDDLTGEKIITNEDDLTSFTLNNSELIVNGKKQTAGIHEKFRTKYLKSKNAEIKYNRTNRKKEFSVNHND